MHRLEFYRCKVVECVHLKEGKRLEGVSPLHKEIKECLHLTEYFLAEQARWEYSEPVC